VTCHLRNWCRYFNLHIEIVSEATLQHNIVELSDFMCSLAFGSVSLRGAKCGEVGDTSKVVPGQNEFRCCNNEYRHTDQHYPGYSSGQRSRSLIT
jgi:hypothetical protein